MFVFVFICHKHYYWVWDRLSWCSVSRIAGRTPWDVSVQVSNGPPDIHPTSSSPLASTSTLTLAFHLDHQSWGSTSSQNRKVHFLSRVLCRIVKHCKWLQRLTTVTLCLSWLEFYTLSIIVMSVQFLQKTAFSLVKSRLSQGSPVCSIDWLSTCQKWPKKCCWLSHNDHIHRWYPFPDQNRPGIRNNWSRQSLA